MDCLYHVWRDQGLMLLLLKIIMFYLNGSSGIFCKHVYCTWIYIIAYFFI